MTSFPPLKWLEQLYLGGCRQETIPKTSSLPQLQTCHLENNQISSMDGAFRLTEKLEQLNLGKNKISVIPRGAMALLNKVSSIRLSDNSLTSIAIDELISLESLSTLYLENNPLLCLTAADTQNINNSRVTCSYNVAASAQCPDVPVLDDILIIENLTTSLVLTSAQTLPPPSDSNTTEQTANNAGKNQLITAISVGLSGGGVLIILFIVSMICGLKRCKERERQTEISRQNHQNSQWYQDLTVTGRSEIYLNVTHSYRARKHRNMGMRSLPSLPSEAGASPESPQRAKVMSRGKGPQLIQIEAFLVRKLIYTRAFRLGVRVFIVEGIFSLISYEFLLYSKQGV